MCWFYNYFHDVVAVQDPSMFKLPPHKLQVGTTYEFRVDVADSAGYSSFATQVKIKERGGHHCALQHSDVQNVSQIQIQDWAWFVYVSCFVLKACLARVRSYQMGSCCCCCRSTRHEARLNAKAPLPLECYFSSCTSHRKTLDWFR